MYHSGPVLGSWQIPTSRPDVKHGVPEGDLPDGGMLVGHVDDKPVLLVRRGTELFAIGATCTQHRSPLPGHSVLVPLRTSRTDGPAGRIIWRVRSVVRVAWWRAICTSAVRSSERGNRGRLVKVRIRDAMYASFSVWISTAMNIRKPRSRGELAAASSRPSSDL